MSRPDPGSVLRRALLGWGLGHLALGRTALGGTLLASEVVAAGLGAWLTVGLADTSLYLVPFVAGVAFLVTWAWQAIDAYRSAGGGLSDVADRGDSPALAMGWLSLPLLVWGAGFWLIGAQAATPAAALDRFVTAWSSEGFSADEWSPSVVDAAAAASADLGDAPDRFRDLRVRLSQTHDDRATAVAEAVHYERRDARHLGIFAGSELVPVADRQVLALDLVARPAPLPGGGDIGAVRWEIVAARQP